MGSPRNLAFCVSTAYLCARSECVVCVPGGGKEGIWNGGRDSPAGQPSSPCHALCLDGAIRRLLRGGGSHRPQRFRRQLRAWQEEGSCRAAGLDRLTGHRGKGGVSLRSLESPREDASGSSALPGGLCPSDESGTLQSPPSGCVRRGSHAAAALAPWGGPDSDKPRDNLFEVREVGERVHH